MCPPGRARYFRASTRPPQGLPERHLAGAAAPRADPGLSRGQVHEEGGDQCPSPGKEAGLRPRGSGTVRGSHNWSQCRRSTQRQAHVVSDTTWC